MLKFRLFILPASLVVSFTAIAGHPGHFQLNYTEQVVVDSIADTLSQREQLVETAMLYLNCSYKYASCNPDIGFDCSGFAYYLFKQAGITLPRSSAEFKQLKPRVDLKKVEPGDLVLFTSRSSKRKTPGHVGIVSAINDNEVSFIHASTSRGVIVSRVSETYYQKRFLFAVRVFDKKSK